MGSVVYWRRDLSSREFAMSAYPACCYGGVEFGIAEFVGSSLVALAIMRGLLPLSYRMYNHL